MRGDVRRIEIVGVAGTGKTTLARTLCARHHEWRTAETVQARSMDHWPSFAHCAPAIAQLFAHALRHRSVVTWDELKMYVYASEWHRFLAARSEYRTGVTLFDQGPLFALACLLWGKSALTSTEWFRSWVHDRAERWALELDVVVELTAPDDVLLARVNEREKSHTVKGKPARETVEVLARHRRAYGSVLGLLQARGGGPHLLRFDTAQTQLEHIADDVSSALRSRATAPPDETAPATEPPRGVAHNVRDGTNVGSTR